MESQAHSQAHGPLQGGALIGGRYRLEAQIGEGGMASVWRAVDQTLDRPVALKFLYARNPAHRAQLVTAFMREAKIAAAVRHSNVVSILDFGTFDDDTPYMVMELLEGESLGQLLERKGPLEPAVVVDLAAHILEGLVAVHEAGIVHRDLKPDNVFVQRERTRAVPKLLDFGISRSVEAEGGRRSALTTQEGKLLGTPEYMSPEQASGEGQVDLRTDIYSLGVIMYEALSGQLPFVADGMGILIVRIITAECTPLCELKPELPQELCDLVARAMRKDRDQRFTEAVEMHRELVSVAQRCFGSKLAQAISVPPSRAAALSSSPHSSPRGSAEPKRAAERDPGLATTAHDAQTHASRRKRASGVALWLGALAAGALTALALVLLSNRPQQAAGAQHFILVHDAPEAQAQAQREAPVTPPPQPTATGPSEPVPDPQAAAPQVLEPEVVERDNGPREGKRNRQARPAQRVALTRTFAAHKQEIGKCFGLLPAGETPTLSLRLTVSRSGRVQDASVSPAQHRSTPVGKCIEKVARGVDFGAQPRELTLRIPLAVRAPK